MPFTLLKRPEGWYVQNKITKKRYSSYPLHFDTAFRQLKALERATDHEHDDYHEKDNGGSLDAEIEGEGFKDFVTSLPSRIMGTISGTRLDYRPQDRKVLETYGNQRIAFIKVVREPIQSFVDTIVNGITLGRFNEIKKEKGYDSFFHLYMFVRLEDKTWIRIEKNHVITLTVNPKMGKDSDSLEVMLPNHPTLNEFLNNCQNKMGINNYFTYNGSSNNCQTYVASCLDANGLLTPQLHDFIVQDASSVPAYSKFIMNNVTDLAHRGDILLNGNGFESDSDSDYSD